jgi:hypothetical protein
MILSPIEVQRFIYHIVIATNSQNITDTNNYLKISVKSYLMC